MPRTTKVLGRELARTGKVGPPSLRLGEKMGQRQTIRSTQIASPPLLLVNGSIKIPAKNPSNSAVLLKEALDFDERSRKCSPEVKRNAARTDVQGKMSLWNKTSDMGT